MNSTRRVISPLVLTVALSFVYAVAEAQTTAFTYQGSLAANGNYANGTYSFQFALFDNSAGGTQIGTTQTATGVAVTNGTFSALVDFGASAFTGANRWLEVSVQGPSEGSYTTLTPRHQLASAPYAIRTLSATTADALSSACAGCVSSANISSVAGSQVTSAVANANNAASALNANNAAQLGGVAASQYVLTTDSRSSDARPPTSGSSNYIQNRSSQQSLADFNISGSGTLGGALSANTVTSTSTSNLLFNGQSTNTIGSWLRLNNTSTGGHNWNLISTGSGNGEGAGKLLFNDQTSGGTRMQLDSTGVAFAGNSTFSGNGTFTGNLTVNGTLNATVTPANFATLPQCKARQTALQTFASGSTASVRFDDTQFCSGVTFDNANDRLVIVTPGLYQITAEVLFLPNSSGFRYMEINSSNGGEVAAASINAVNGFSTQMNAVGMVRLNAGDVVSLAAAQTSGGNLNTEVFNGRAASLTVNWVSP